MKKALTDTFLKKTGTPSKKTIVTDTQTPGLICELRPTGVKSFRFRYRWDNKQQYVTIGKYPAISLVYAREKAGEYRSMLEKKLNPKEELIRLDEQKLQKTKENKKQAVTVKQIGDDWLAKKKNEVKDSYYQRLVSRMDNDVYKHIGSRPAVEITPIDVMDCLKVQEARGATEQLRRVKRYIHDAYKHAMTMQTIPRMANPADFDAAVFQKHIPKQRLHLVADEIPAFVSALKEYTGRPETRLGVELLMLTNLRPGEVLKLKWDYVYRDRLAIPAEVMKMNRAHDVPLSKQALEKLEELKQLTGKTKYLFPSMGRGATPTMRVESLSKCLDILGYKNKLNPHGLRATFSTIANDAQFHPDAIERQLAHKDLDSVRAAYDRSKHWDERVKLSQWWADWLDNCLQDNVINFRKKSEKVDSGN